MTHLDRQKLERLRADLSGNTTLIEGLIESLRMDVDSLSSAGNLDSAAQAELVHRVTGSASMLVPQTMLARLNRLETAIRSGDVAAGSMSSTVDELGIVTDELDLWITEATKPQ